MFIEKLKYGWIKNSNKLKKITNYGENRYFELKAYSCQINKIKK